MKTVVALLFIMVGPGLLALGFLAGAALVGPALVYAVFAVLAALPLLLFVLLWKKHIGLSYWWGLLVVPMGYVSLAFGAFFGGLGALQVHCHLTHCPPL